MRLYRISPVYRPGGWSGASAKDHATDLLPYPKGKSHPCEKPGCVTMAGDEFQFDWAGLVPCFVHPLKVAIVEAMVWVGMPLSASELTRLFLGEYHLTLVSYHVKGLAKVGAIEEANGSHVRSESRQSYRLPSQDA